MTAFFRPRRGKRSTAESQNIVLKRGEVFFESPTGGVGTGIGRIKVGDGTTPYTSLPYFMNLDNFPSNKVTFDNTGTNLSSTNVEAAIKELETNFQDGVDDIYDAVVAKGSTPASTALADVVAGIMAIQTSPPTQTKTCTPSTSAQNITPDSGYLLSSVSVSAIQTQTKTCTPSTSAQNITPDSGKYLTKVTVNAISTQTKTVTSSRSAQTVTPDSGKYLTKVTINKYPDASGTYTASSRGSALDMGATNNLRYVNTNSVPNTNSGTYTYASGSTGGTVDMGSTNSYRYVNASNVYSKGVADGRSLSSKSRTVFFNAGASSGTFTFDFGTKIVGISGISFGNRGSKIQYPQISISGNTVTLTGSWVGDAGNVTVTCVGY